MLLTFHVEEDGSTLHLVVVVGDAVADPAAVVAPGRLLHALKKREVMTYVEVSSILHVYVCMKKDGVSPEAPASSDR